MGILHAWTDPAVLLMCDVAYTALWGNCLFGVTLNVDRVLRIWDVTQMRTSGTGSQGGFCALFHLVQAEMDCAQACAPGGMSTSWESLRAGAWTDTAVASL